MLVSTLLISTLPPGRLRTFLGRMSYKMSFRVLFRGLSCVITYHDEKYRPQGNGFCVANHTSPIDVAILSSNDCYSLVRVVFLNGTFFCSDVSLVCVSCFISCVCLWRAQRCLWDALGAVYSSKQRSIYDVRFFYSIISVNSILSSLNINWQVQM